MMFRIAVQELRYMLKSPQTAVGFSIFFLLTLLAMVSTNVSIGGGGNVDVNSPYAISETLMVMNVFGIFVVPAFIANAILRDVDHKFDGILFSTPVSKPDYLFGRFIGAFAALTIAMLGAPLGTLLGTFWPTVDPETLSPTNLWHYIYVYFALVVPASLIVSAIIYAIAVKSRSLMYTYLAAMGLLILYFVGLNLLRAPEFRELKALADPFAFSTFREMTRYWTAVERNTTLIGYEGLLLTNRLIWLGITTVIASAAYFMFSFRAPAKLRKEKISKKETADRARKDQIPLGIKGSPVWSARTSWAQLMLRTRFEISSVYKSLPFIIIMGFSLFLLLTALISRTLNYGVEAYPVTRLMIEAVQGSLGIALVVVLIFYSADIIWRERSAKFSEIIDALPTPNWVFVFSKLVALAFILVSIMTIGIVSSVFVQLANAYSGIEISTYLHRGLFHFVTPFILVAVLSAFVQVLSKNRFIGMMIMVLYLISTLALQALGFENPLYRFAGNIPTPMSDMNGSGRFIIGNYWLMAYWASVSVLLLMVTYLLWNRGTLQPIKYRIRSLRAFLSPGMAAATAVVFAAVIGTGGFVYYNTHILNQFITTDDLEELSVAYEKKYRQYAGLPMPRTTDIKIDVDIFPYKRRVEVRSTQVLENKTDQEIPVVHIVFPPGAEVVEVSLEGATLASFDDDFSYHIFVLEVPMQPGEKRSLEFETLIQQQGFTHERNSVTLVRNGTFINNSEFAPYIGFWPGGMMTDRNTRREYGLEPLPRTPKLEDASQWSNNYLRQDSDFVSFETTVSTVASQRVVAPGYLERDWVEGDRHYYTYKMDAPILNFYSYLSAEYEVVSENWNDIQIEVFHHKPHTYNVGRMIDSVKDSIAYFNTAFSPYQHRQVRILEFPAYRNFAQAFPNTIPYSEGIGFIADISGEGAIDMPYYVTAHEMAHQWWAHQVMSANTQGGTMLVETLAQYSALLVMDQHYGKDKIRKFLKFELDRYLRGRATDPEGELPLYRVENQQYIHYNKGSLIMYALRDYLGEDVVNRSLRRLIAMRAFQGEPYAISTDLISILKEESPENVNLIEDFFEKITIFDVKASGSTVQELADGTFKVTIDAEAVKIYADAEGNETEAMFDIPVDIGIFSKSPANADFGSDHVLHMEKHTVGNGSSTIELIVNGRPTHIGVDPYNKLIDRNSNDNIRPVDAVELLAASDADTNSR